MGREKRREENERGGGGWEGRGVGRNDYKESCSCTSQSYIEVYNPIFLHREVGNFKSLILHRTTRVQNTLVLLRTRNIDYPSPSSLPFILYGNAGWLSSQLVNGNNTETEVYSQFV